MAKSNTKESAFKLSSVTFQKFSIDREPKEQGKFNIDIKPSGYINKESKTYLLVLDIEIFDKQSYNISLSAFGYFEYKEIDGESSLGNFFYTNAPALVFPYIRSYIMAVTALSGLNTINIPVMNLSSLRDQLKKKTVEIAQSNELAN